jgi:alkaline phosphatase D
MAELDRQVEGGPQLFWMDGWDGYPNARRRLLDSIATYKPRNPIVVGGDRHAFFVADLERDFTRLGGPTLATEFVGTSITSEGPSANGLHQALKANPHVKNGRSDKRGYATVDLAAARCTSWFRGAR